MAKQRSRQCGVTLIEQIMVIAIVGVLAAIAAPALTPLLQRNQVRLAQVEIMAALQHARGVAVTSGQSTLFCPSTDSRRCSTTARWESGWLIGHDPARTGQPAAGALRARPAYAGITVLGDSGRRLVRFRPDGTSIGSTNTWRICRSGKADEALVVIVANTGRARADKATADQAASCAAAQ